MASCIFKILYIYIYNFNNLKYREIEKEENIKKSKLNEIRIEDLDSKSILK